MSVIEKDNKIMTLAQNLKPHHTLSTGLYNSLCYTNLCGRIIIYIYIQWNLDLSFFKGMEKTNNECGKTINPGNYYTL